MALTLLNKLGVNNLALNINSIGCKQCRPAYNAALREYPQGQRESAMRHLLRAHGDQPLRVLDCKGERCGHRGGRAQDA